MNLLHLFYTFWLILAIPGGGLFAAEMNSRYGRLSGEAYVVCFLVGAVLTPIFMPAMIVYCLFKGSRDLFYSIKDRW